MNSPVPLIDQLADPLIAALLLAWLAVVAAAVIVALRAPVRVQAAALLAASLALGLRFCRFDAPGVRHYYDEIGQFQELSGFQPPLAMNNVFGERGIASAGNNLTAKLPWYVVCRLEGGAIGARVIGAWWSALLACGIVVFGTSWLSVEGSLLAAVVATATPWALSLSRFLWGQEVQLLQLELYAALMLMMTTGIISHAIFATLAAGVLLGAMQQSYLAARVTILMAPLFLLAAPRLQVRLVLLLGAALLIAVVCSVPYYSAGPHTAINTGPALVEGFSWNKLRITFGSLVWESYGGGGTLSWPGMQRQPLFVLVLLAVGLFVIATRKQHLVPFALCIFVGAVPPLVAYDRAGTSHRMMMMLLPLAVVAGLSVDALPEGRWRRCAVAVTASSIVCDTLVRWYTWG